MFGSEKRLIGLDLGASSAKVACVRVTARGVQLAGAGQGRVPEGAISEAGVADPELVGGAITEALADAKVGRHAGRVVAGVPTRYLTVRVLTVPTMDHSELREAAKWEAAQYLPYPVDEGVFDFLELGPGTATGTLDVLSISARRTVIDGIVKAIELAGLEPAALDASPLALGRVFLSPGGPAASFAGVGLGQAAATREQSVLDQAVAIVDIGNGSTDVAIFRGQQLRVARSIPIGGVRFTAAIAAAAGLDQRTAEERKLKEARLRPETEGHDLTRESALNQSVREVATELAEELQRSLDYFRAQSRWMPTNRIVLTGDGARIAGLDRFLTEHLGVEVASGDALVGAAVGIGSEIMPARVSPVALGLALWEVTAA